MPPPTPAAATAEPTAAVTPTPPVPATTPAPAEEEDDDAVADDDTAMAMYEYIGCYVDTLEDRVLADKLDSPDMTIEVSAAAVLRVVQRAKGGIVIPRSRHCFNIVVHSRHPASGRASLECLSPRY